MTMMMNSMAESISRDKQKMDVHKSNVCHPHRHHAPSSSSSSTG